MVTFVDRWSLCRGVLVSLTWPMEQPTVVAIVDICSFYASDLKTGLTVVALNLFLLFVFFLFVSCLIVATG